MFCGLTSKASSACIASTGKVPHSNHSNYVQIMSCDNVACVQTGSYHGCSGRVL